MNGRSEHADMFARAVVVKLARGPAFAIELASGLFTVGNVSATQQRILGQPYAPEHSRDCFCMDSLALMGGAADSQFVGSELEAISGAARDKRDGLNGLDGRAGGSSQLIIAEAGDDAAVGLNDHNYTAVTRFDN